METALLTRMQQQTLELGRPCAQVYARALAGAPQSCSAQSELGKLRQSLLLNMSLLAIRQERWQARGT